MLVLLLLGLSVSVRCLVRWRVVAIGSAQRHTWVCACSLSEKTLVAALDLDDDVSKRDMNAGHSVLCIPGGP